jgi:6-phosphogluconate dehydrogenase
MMIGGDSKVVQRLDSIFATLAPGIGNAAHTPGREKFGGNSERG